MSEPLFFLCSFPVNFAGKNGGGGYEMSTSERGVCVCEKKEKEKKSVKCKGTLTLTDQRGR